MHAVLVENVKQASLESFLYSRGLHYSTVTLTHLAETFELPLIRVRSIVSDLIANKGLLASWDETTSIIVMHKATASKVEGTALCVIDTLNTLTESVEKLDR